MTAKNIFGFAPLLAIALFASLAHAQLRGTLTTSDIAVDLAAGTEAPQLQRLRSHGEPQWVNTLPEALPISVAHDGERIALKWHLIRGLSSARPVYMLRSGMMGWLTVMQNTSDLPPALRGWHLARRRGVGPAADDIRFAGRAAGGAQLRAHFPLRTPSSSKSAATAGPE
jgi:hypothetical protein